MMLAIQTFIFRQHRSTKQMSSIVTGRVAWSVGLSVIIVSPAKTAELSEMPLGLWTKLSPSNHVLGGGPDSRFPHAKQQFWGRMWLAQDMPAGPVVDSASSRTVTVQMPTGVYQMRTKTCTTNSLTIDWDHQLIWIHDQKLIHIKRQPSETAVIVNTYRTEDHNQWWTPSILFTLLQVICWEGLPALINFCHSFLSSAIFFSATYFPFIRSLSRCILLLTRVAFTLILPWIISCSNDSCLSTWPNYTRLQS